MDFFDSHSHYNDEKFDEYVKELNELFDKYEKNGIATVPNYTEVYIGEV